MIALQIIAALLIGIGSGLVLLALWKLEDTEDMGRVSPGHWSQLPGRSRRTSWSTELPVDRAITPTEEDVRLLGPGRNQR